MYKFICFLLLVASSFYATMLSASTFALPTETVIIKTSAICNMCKYAIEKALSYQKGVESSNLDVATKSITVVFNSTKTNIDKIKKAIIKSGYDADELSKNARAYKKLPDCCKDASKCKEAQ